MREICDERGIATDIATDEASRIYGPAWLDFVGDCRAMLGSESGSNVFDFDGKIEKTYKAKTLANLGRLPSYAEFVNVVAQRESEIDIGQISPRVFECAVMRTPMVLFKGRYSDAVREDEHYIALEKDFSNVEAVIVGSGLFGYRAFVRAISERIEARAARSPAVDQSPAPEAAGAPRQADAPASGASPLIEVPTPTPKSMADFRLQQRLLHGSTLARSAQKVDAILMRSLNDNRKALSGMTRLHNWTARALLSRRTRPDFERHPEPATTAIEQFERAWLRASQERSDYIKRRQALDAALTDASSEARRPTHAEIITLDENWIVRLNGLHRTAAALFHIAFAELEAQIRSLTQNAATRSSTPRVIVRTIALFATTAVAAIRFNAAKINFIKQAVDRSPAARLLAFRLLALLRR
jgi:hypothetical protein